MLRLNIEQQYAKLALSIKEPAISLHMRPATLELHTEPAVLDIRQPQGTLEIDQSPCRASYGYKNVTDFTREFAQKGKAAVLAAIGKIAEDGDRMARIESGENVIVALAKESAAPKSVEVGLVPVARPSIRYHPRSPEYQVQPGKLSAQYQRGTLGLQLNRGTVEGYLAQHQSIRMWTTGTLDFSV